VNRCIPANILYLLWFKIPDWTARSIPDVWIAVVTVIIAFTVRGSVFVGCRWDELAGKQHWITGVASAVW